MDYGYLKVKSLLVEHFFYLLGVQLELGLRSPVGLEGVPPDEAEISFVTHPVPFNVLVANSRLLLAYPLQQI